MRRTLLGNIRGDEGYEVRFRVGGGEIEYREGAESIMLDATEIAPRIVEFGLFPDARWGSPAGERAPTDAERQRVLERVAAALKYRGLEPKPLRSA